MYDFAEGSRDMRDLLGGKGANVAEMTRVLGPERVPAGFTITTEACVAYMEADRTEPDDLEKQVDAALERLEEHAGKTLGDDEDPLLVSVRSGARESMPGHAGHGPEPGHERHLGRGPGPRDRLGALRLGLLPPVRCRCSPTSAAGSAGRPSRRRSRSASPTPAWSWTPICRSTTSRGWSTTSRSSTATRPARTSRRTRASSWRRPSGRCSTPGSGRGPRSTGASTASPTSGGPR